MNGFIARKLAGIALIGAVASSGCFGLYNEVVDPCWPQRYSYVARREVCEAFAPQVHNGRILDQTMWNYHFEPGSDRLTAGGQANLVRLLRRRPAPDPIIYLATAEDVAYDPAHPDKLVEERNSLDNRRREAIEKFVSAQTAGRGVGIQVVVHDPAPVGLPATSTIGSFGGLQKEFTGKFSPIRTQQ